MQLDVRPVVQAGAAELAVVDGVPVATQRRPMEPVFGGISGATSTTCTVVQDDAEASGTCRPATGSTQVPPGPGSAWRTSA